MLSGSSFPAINWAGKASNSRTTVCVGLIGEQRVLHESPTSFRIANGVEQCSMDGWPTHLVLEILPKQSRQKVVLAHPPEFRFSFLAHAPEFRFSCKDKQNIQGMWCHISCMGAWPKQHADRHKRSPSQASSPSATNLLRDSLGHDLKHVFVLELVRQAAPHGVVLRAASPHLLGARPGTSK